MKNISKSLKAVRIVIKSLYLSEIWQASWQQCCQICRVIIQMETNMMHILNRLWSYNKTSFLNGILGADLEVWIWVCIAPLEKYIEQMNFMFDIYICIKSGRCIYFIQFWWRNESYCMLLCGMLRRKLFEFGVEAVSRVLAWRQWIEIQPSPMIYSHYLQQYTYTQNNLLFCSLSFSCISFSKCFKINYNVVSLLSTGNDLFCVYQQILSVTTVLLCGKARSTGDWP